jgi:hypothetical protein
VVPKVGPFKALAFKPPTPEAERLFMEGFNATVTRYKALLAALRDGRLHLEDVNLDTGRAARAGDYSLADRTFSELLDRLAQHKFDAVSPDLRRSILAFYDGAKLALRARVDDPSWNRTFAELYVLEHERR